MTSNVGSIAHQAWQTLSDVPSSISGQVMQDIAQQSVFFTNNYLKTSIGSTGIADTYFSILVNLTKAWTLSRMANVGAQFNWHLGEFSVNKGGSNNTEQVQVQQFFDMAMMELKFIGRPIRIQKANG